MLNQHLSCEPERKLDITQVKRSISWDKFYTKYLRCRTIEKLLSERKYTRSELARIFDVNRSTIWRDINDLSLILPICEDGYYLYVNKM
jgi:DNA invertase Pin-like site-specific DNA recombinase